MLYGPLAISQLPVGADLLGLEPEWLEGVTHYFPHGLPTSPPPGHHEQTWADWARENGGQDVYYTHAMLTIQATQDRAVVLQDPRVHDTRTRVIDGVIGSPQGLGGNGLQARRFYIDLDPTPPIARYIDGDEKESALFSIRKGETETFLLIAKATCDRHSWTVTIPCTVDGVSFELRVRGDPLITVGPEGVPQYYWTDGVGWRRSESAT